MLETLSITSQKFSKCRKNGIDRLPNGNLRRLLTGPHFEYEIQFHNVRIEITLIVTLQPIFYKSWFTAGVKDVKDILDTDGNSILATLHLPLNIKSRLTF